MHRLLVHVEGQTEESFVNEVLRDHLLAKGYDAVSARIVGNARLRQHRGGIRSWPSIRKDIINHLKGDPSCIATTMFDYYGLPQQGDGAWPGRADASRAPAVEKRDLAEVFGNRFNPHRFIPFVVVHEFEALLFSDCAAFSRGIARPDLEAKFRQVRDQFATPEEINDSPVNAPSKRLQAILPGYEKPLLGTLAALEIGLHSIRSQCRHFDSWLTVLETQCAQA